MKPYYDTIECMGCGVVFNYVKDYVLIIRFGGEKLELGPYCGSCKDSIKNYFSLVKKDG